MFKRSGSLIVALVIVFMLFYVQQGILAPQVSPVFVETLSSEKLFVELSGDLFCCSSRQVVEVSSVKDLLCYVNDESDRSILINYLKRHALIDGQSIELNRESNILHAACSKFMSAGRRMTLGVALHPDRMTVEDWSALPGVGESMARTITTNRAQYGDFYTYEALSRVRGIASKSLDRWREYF